MLVSNLFYQLIEVDVENFGELLGVFMVGIISLK